MKIKETLDAERKSMDRKLTHQMAIIEKCLKREQNMHAQLVRPVFSFEKSAGCLLGLGRRWQIKSPLP